MTTPSGDRRPLRTIREAAGVSLGQVVKLTDYSKGHLSKVENGLRPASPRLVRVYESLREKPVVVPTLRPPRPNIATARHVAVSYGGEIRRARNALGLSQRDLADLAGLSHVYISKLENGQAFGTEYVARQLDKRLEQGGELVRLYAAEMNWAPEPVAIPRAAHLFTVALARPSEGVESVAAEAATRLEHLRQRRHLAGPAAAVDDVVAQLIDLHAAATVVSANHSFTLRDVEAHYAEYLSWLAEELSDMVAMREWMAVAVRLGAENGDAAIASYAATRMSATALRADDPGAALCHVQPVVSDPTLPPKLRCIALQREARARARRGDREGFRRAMDAYYALTDDVLAASSEGPEWGPSWDPLLGSSRLLEATGLMELEEFRAAAEVFAMAMPQAFPAGRESNLSLRHARVRFAIREATVYAHVHECDRAADVIESFLPAVQIASGTIRQDLRRLASILSRRRAIRLRALTPDIITLARTMRPRTRVKRMEALDG